MTFLGVKLIPFKISPLTLGQAESTVHPQSHQSVRLSAVDHGVVGPQAQPVVREEGDQVMGEEQQHTDAG